MPILGPSASPFDELVERATMENQTTENWALILDICDRVKEGGSKAAKACLLSLKKRLNHRDPHVILYTLTVLDGCVNNCGSVFNSELCSREFVAELRSKATGSQRQVAEKTRELIKKWAETECKSDPSLRAIPFLYNELKADGYDFPGSGAATTTTAKKNMSSEEAKETDDLAKAILLSLKEEQQKQKVTSPLYPTQGATAKGDAADSAKSPQKSQRSAKALYDFEAAEENELTFSAGELITVTDDSDANWWRGFNARGEGLFPSSFVTYDLSVSVVTTGAATTTTTTATNGSTSSKKKGVQFDDHVDVKVIEQQQPQAPAVIDEKKLDRCLELLQNADPTGDRPDPAELLELEEQCLAMAPLIEREIEALDKQTNLLSEVNTKLVDAFNLYHAAMNEASEQLRAQASMPFPNPYTPPGSAAVSMPQPPHSMPAQPTSMPPQMYSINYNQH